ncbi:oligosaccharyl transferase subunit [Histoplasma capsulatum var. duboisii H88]|uniref:Dolichyl-diphosphooligosaccharide--protein glycosyltransferase subunit 1 n=2 Tax=Ajellomyces capsulatus TaxID=5037 RepID=F0UIK7_AJEC8|nr:oligosaccharyl transferase alpha subunit [Histoplasma capsulatum H143]EGC46406.1 oligosaccharyl transferase subunit [Histoplasma capsulatum var. duboisii H88]QSS57029.1 oligosaccharyltransferase alpha subunit [Histoplasma capsulatum var. duboisii H88]
MRLLPTAAVLCGFLTPSISGVLTTTANSTTHTSSRLVLSNDFSPPKVFKNINLLRNINLEKGYVRETVNVVIENIAKEPQEQYFIPFASDVIVGGLEVRDKNAPSAGKFLVEATEVLQSSPNQYFVVHFPESLKASSQITLSISYYILQALAPLPAAIEQDAKQYLSYSFPVYAPSAYTTDNQKTKIKFPSSNVPDYTETSGLKSGADPDRQGSTYTYGPYKNSKISTGATVPMITVRYEFTKPVITCSLLERDIEISHWGGNLATEERLWLRNDGAKLSKHFSRVGWAMRNYHNLPTSAMSDLRIPLLPGSVDAYFTDDIGNVSTSRFRPGVKNREALLELKPRYPVFGGWKYSFRIGWNNALSSFLRKAGGESYVLKLPFLEGPKVPEGVQYEKIQLRVILPEGARAVKYELVDGVGMPYMVESELGLHKTFMDTVGRTVLTLRTTNVADEAREGHIIVTYDYPTLAILRKPLTMAAGLFSVFVTVWLVGNLDVSIKKR